MVVNHAFTGNSEVAGEKGWWGAAIGDHKVIDTLKYTVIAFNIPGNGYMGTEADMITNYQHWEAIDVARIFNYGAASAFSASANICLSRLFVGRGNSLGNGSLSS